MGCQYRRDIWVWLRTNRGLGGAYILFIVTHFLLLIKTPWREAFLRKRCCIVWWSYFLRSSDCFFRGCSLFY